MLITITLFAKPKAYFKTVLLKIHRLLYAIIYSVHLYLRYSRRCSPQSIYIRQNYLHVCKNLGGRVYIKRVVLQKIYGIF